MATIRRQRHVDPYERIDRGLLQDPELSWETAGLLAYALSLPDDWRLTTAHLTTFRNAGREKVQRMLREGQAAGYIVRLQHRRPNGTYYWEYIICEYKEDAAKLQNPRSEPETGFPALANPSPYIRDSEQKTTRTIGPSSFVQVTSTERGTRRKPRTEPSEITAKVAQGASSLDGTPPPRAEAKPRKPRWAASCGHPEREYDHKCRGCLAERVRLWDVV